MHQGRVVFGAMEEVVFGRPASEAVVEQLKTDQSNGLSQTEAKARLEQFGPNALLQAKQRTAFEILISQFQSLIVLMLGAATAIAFAMGDQTEAIAILVVIVINAAIGFLESKAHEDCYVATYEYKSYANVFYAKKRKPTNPKHASDEWLMHGNVDKPTYWLAKYGY